MSFPVTPPRARTPRFGQRVLSLPAAMIAALAATLAIASPMAAASPATMVSACSGANLRTSTSMTAAVKAHLASSVKVIAVATVGGSRWHATCPTAKSGSTWYRISAINGKSVRSLYGRSYLYAAAGVLKATPAAAPSAPPVAVDAFGDELTRLLNLDRAALHKPAYLVDARLAQVARDAAFTCPTNASMHLRGRARDLADRAYFSHTVPGCFAPGTKTPYRSLAIVRTVFGYTTARSEILHMNTYGAAPSAYRLGCDITGGQCVGGTTTAPYTVTIAQRRFMSSAPHRAAELNSYKRVGCASASAAGKTYFACLFADAGPTGGTAPAPAAPSPAAPAAAALSRTMVAACSSVNLRTGTSTTSTAKTKLASSTKLTVVAMLGGSKWTTICPTAKSGSTWYRISAINGKSVRSLYGRSYLYVATSLLRAAPSR